MKTILVRKNSLLVLVAAFILSAFFVACSKDDSNNDNNRTYTTSGNASGTQVTPPVTTTTATGSLTGTYNAQTNVWQYQVNWVGLTSAASIVEVHGPADVGEFGPLLFALTITTPGVNGSATGTVTLTDAQEAYLLAKEMYYTVLSAVHVNGEIRGQITATAH